MDIKDLLSRLDGVKQSGGAGQYVAKCPAHDDRTASLCVSTGDDGRLLLLCQAGCDTKEVLSAMGLCLKDLFPEKQKDPGRVEAEYFYNGKDGKPLLKKQKIRYPDGKKSFYWCHLENGRWVKGRAGIKPGLYRKEALVGNNPVYVVEGEKDADTLAKYKLPAVSSPDGAGKGAKWREEYNGAFQGKNVLILQDNDAPGKEFAAEVARNLKGMAKSVKVVDLTSEWAELPEKGDISDVFLMDNPDDVLIKLGALSLVTPEWEPTAGDGTVPGFYDGRKFLHNVMGDYLVETLSACKINDAIHIYENGVYKQGEETIHGHMLNLVPDLTDTKRREVYKYIKVSLKTPVKEISPPNFIPFATKIYDLNTGAFLDYAPEFVFLNRFPYDYKPGAPYQPAVAETIAQIADGNQEVIDLLYEAIGNCFYLLNSYRGAVMLYGKSGNNGKSTLLNMITQLLGRENASFLSLQDTTERFRLVEIYGKAANIGDDIPNTYLPDSAAFKKLVTGERVMAEKKGQDPFPFKPFAKMFFAMNGLPPVSDKSKAFFGRLLLIPLNKDFSKSGVQDVGLKDRRWTKEEMEYLTCMAMEGLKRLMRQGDFTKPGIVREAIAGYERDNNPVEEFLEEYGDVCGKPVQVVYDDFFIWCGRSGHRNAPTRRRFTDAVLDLTGYASEPIRHPYFGDKTGRCFVRR